MVRNSSILGWVFLLVVCIASSKAFAAERDVQQQFYFNIPRLSADKALTRFARQADLTLLFPYQLVKKYQTRALYGRYTIRDGLEIMLSGTDIQISTGFESSEPDIDLMLDENGAEPPPISSDRQGDLTASVITLTVASEKVDAEDVTTPQTEPIEEMVVVGSRRLVARSVSESPVPVDIISAEQLAFLGNGADLTDSLRTLVPSYIATPATGDASAFVRPTSLRGMSPDQTLVLVNGKRRHRSAVVHFFAPAAGNGSHGVDVGMVPTIAIKNVQILRDGAAAQYGSDAIAGVINIELNDASQGGEIRAAYGQFYDGESSIQVAANLGLSLGGYGFLNLSLEATDNDALSRGIIRPDAQALIDAGVPGVGADSPFGDAPFTQTWGRPETAGQRFYFNSEYDVSPRVTWYAFGNYADTEGRYRFFYREPNHPSITQQGLATLFPAGYTPYLDGYQSDFSVISGLLGGFSDGTNYDVSVAYGQNELDYYLFNTLNPSLPVLGNGEPVMNFDVGAYRQEEFNFNVDLSRQLNDSLYLSYGLEHRHETFTLLIGDENARVGEGPSGFASPNEFNAGAFSRDNLALYLDLEHDLSAQWLIQYALRHEDYSDFGSTTNVKIASRYTLTEGFALRGALSTGFHAPTPGQSNISSTITTFDGQSGIQVEEGLVPANSSLARGAGGTELKEEESVNLSFGFTRTLGVNWDLTLDFYRVDVQDRIYRTGDIPVPNAEQRTLSFYTNALDVSHRGFDLVVNGRFDWGRDLHTQVTLAAAHNEVNVTGQTPVAGINPVSAATIEDIESNYPKNRVTLSTRTDLSDDVNLLLRATYYGSHFDERGTIDGEPGNRSARIQPITYIDAELGWQATDQLRVVMGFSNIFDTYVDEIQDDGVFANRQAVGLQYPRRTAANYEGGSWYLRGVYRF
ncbi:hypothetical protein GCM10008090_05280 [Arenicella chitinivorans]|uniref:TonB-dependent receptor n=1 Tax=Arenicella chitinivorans TaxID=1329800 RepID=A0A918RJN9_9GAMM|nr:TonB-dependent receptor [Arenicella chitinivorans]GGZ99600.1 hypothetical protein GCM10008090_05280 [Arenicella chitinivorans]